MKRNEKQLLLVAAVLFVLVLVVRVVPLAWAHYSEGQDEIALLQQRIARFEQLVADERLWMERESLKEAEIAEYAGWIFEGSTPNLIGSAVQRALRQAMEQASLNIRETQVARYSYVGDWLLVSQEMNFILEQNQILPFLNALQAARPRLHIAAFSVTRSRRQYSGSVTVVAFGRIR